jgi:cytoskeleton protein RodZ
VESFGAKLKREREKKGITLDDISLSTKIGTRLLRALEDEHFDQLPGGIFNKGFVRAYARHLGMDEDQAITDYLAASGDGPPPKTLEPQLAEALEARAEDQPTGVAQIPWGILAIALSLVALGFALWGFNSREKEREGREAASHSTPTIMPAQASESATTPSNPPAGSDVTPAPNTDPPSAATQAPSPTLASLPATQRASGEFVVLIKAHDESWISMKVDGNAPAEATLTAETEKPIHAKDSVTIRAGNVGALDFYFNGNKLPPQGEVGEVKNLTFGPEGLQAPKPAIPEPASTPPQP